MCVLAVNLPRIENPYTVSGQSRRATTQVYTRKMTEAVTLSEEQMGQLVEKLSDKLAPMLRLKSPRHSDPPLEESDRDLSGMVQPGRVRSSCMFTGGGYILSLCLKGGVRSAAASAARLGMGRQERQWESEARYKEDFRKGKE